MQQAVKLIIEPIFEADFQNSSYGYRPNRNAKQASEEIRKYLNYGCTEIVDMDISSFFDNIDHRIMISLVEKRIREKILNLTNNRARSLMTPEEAKEMLIPVLGGWGNYFAHSLASNIFTGIWEYAQCRLMYMYCHQHNIPRKWKNRNIPKYNLSIMCTKPSTFLGKRHNAMS